MTKDQIRKVARAIYEADPAGADVPFDRLAPVMKTQYEKMARAAINALTHPLRGAK